MPRQNRHLIAMALALLATGCLLPQPDTPPVPPSSVGAPFGTAPAPNQEITAPERSKLTGTLTGRLEGLSATAIAAVAVDTGTLVTEQPLDAQGAFTLTLPTGKIWLELVTPAGRLRISQALDVNEAQTRTLTLKASGPTVTIEEQATLAPAPASPSPQSSPPATPLSKGSKAALEPSQQHNAFLPPQGGRKPGQTA